MCSLGTHLADFRKLVDQHGEGFRGEAELHALKEGLGLARDRDSPGHVVRALLDLSFCYQLISFLDE